MSVDALLYGANFAHRGLWRPGGPPENSLEAFEAACAAGYGIELDVRLSADGEAIVFHDETLERMTIESGLTEERTTDELKALRLLGSTQFIPSLADALDLIAGRSPLLVELKTPPGHEGPLEKAAARALGAYEGPVAVLSFNPAALSSFALHAPATYLGLNCDSSATNLDEQDVDFLSVHKDLVDDPAVRAWAQAGGLVAAWTIRSPVELEAVGALVSTVIFEGFEP